MGEKHYTQSSLMIRWAYLWEEFKPLNTNTCALFWRSVIVSPFKIAGPLLVVALVLHWSSSVVLTVLRGELGLTESGWQMLLLVLGSVAVAGIGAVTGFWAYLHKKTCLPVTIEGGLVPKGSCPLCINFKLVLDDDEDGEVWNCRRCGGYFVPSDDDQDAEAKEHA